MSFHRSGNTAAIPLPTVLQGLQQSQASGTLKVRREQIEKCIYFKKGQIIFATSTDVRDRLGEMLVKAGYLTRENLDTALDLFKKNAGLKKIGAILVENEFVSPKNLFSGLKTQVKDIIYSLFLWGHAEFIFEETLAPDVIQLQINLPELISEIIERMKKEV